MASRISSKGKKATRSDKPGGPDCEHTVAMTTSGNSARLDSSVSHSPLFRLSAELRNTIYRLVLVEDCDSWGCEQPVVIDKDSGIPEPALLLSNKIIRSEALGIFYHENDFDCQVRNFHPAPVLLLQSKLKMPFSKHPMLISITSIHRDVSYGTWDNLVSWLHLCHKRQCPSFFHGTDCISEYGRDAQAEMSVLLGLFEVVERCPEMPSEMLDRVIASMYLAWESGAYSF